MRSHGRLYPLYVLTIPWLLAISTPVDAGERFGIDVSHHSGEVDWRQVRGNGNHFAFAKATEGVDAADATFAGHWQGLAAAGIVRGAYHFYVTEDDPEAQAAFFLSRIKLSPGDLPPVVDVETIGAGTRGTLIEPLRRFLGHIEGELGVKPIIYTSARFWNDHYDASFGDYPLWVAHYAVEAPTLPDGWRTWTLWQFEGDARIPGVEKAADRSRLHPDLTLEELRVRKLQPASTTPATAH